MQTSNPKSFRLVCCVGDAHNGSTDSPTKPMMDSTARSAQNRSTRPHSSGAIPPPPGMPAPSNNSAFFSYNTFVAEFGGPSLSTATQNMVVSSEYDDESSSIMIQHHSEEDDDNDDADDECSQGGHDEASHRHRHQDDDESSGMDASVEGPPPVLRTVSVRDTVTPSPKGNQHYYNHNHYDSIGSHNSNNNNNNRASMSSLPQQHPSRRRHRTSEVSPLFHEGQLVIVAPHRDRYVEGQWKDGLYDCFRLGVCHVTLWNAFCCPQILAAQVFTRLGLNWLGLVDNNNHDNNNAKHHNSYHEKEEGYYLDDGEEEVFLTHSNHLGYHRRESSFLSTRSGSSPSPFQNLNNNTSIETNTTTAAGAAGVEEQPPRGPSSLSMSLDTITKHAPPPSSSQQQQQQRRPSPQMQRHHQQQQHYFGVTAFSRVFVLTCLFWTSVVVLSPPLPMPVIDAATHKFLGFQYDNDDSSAFPLSLKFLIAAFVIYTFLILVRLRTQVRKRYGIPNHGEGEDVIVSLCCPCCSVAQLARQTQDDNDAEAYCCTPLGLAGMPQHANNKMDANDDTPVTKNGGGGGSYSFDS